MKIEVSYLDMEAIHRLKSQIPACGEIKVWLIDCNDYRVRKEDAACLTDEETARAVRFAREEDRQRFLLGHVALKKLLGIYAGAPWQGIRFSIGPQGKPYWDGYGSEGAVHFNMSHSGAYIVMAFAKDTPVGIDIEKIESNQRVDSIAKRFFHPQEWAEVQGEKEGRKFTKFYRIWTMKEALLKGIGCGLTVPTNAFYFEKGTGVKEDEYRVSGLDAPGWRVHTVMAKPGYEVSVAYDLARA